MTGSQVFTALRGTVLLAILLPAPGFSQERPAALVEAISGEVFLRSSAGAQPVKLDPRLDLARRLYPGQQVRSAQGGALRMRLPRSIKEIRGPSDWFTIPPALSSSDRMQLALEEYGRLGGRDRSDEVTVFSPSDHSVVLPSQFVVRWNQGPAIRAIALSIQEPGGREIWKQDSVDGSLGSLTSETARQALSRHRAGGRVGPLSLRLVDSDGNVGHSSFSVISVGAERELFQQLRAWDRDSLSVMAHLGRAAIFARARLLSLAADEYEAALLQAPESRDLLVSTILAHRRTGNTDRIRELTRRVPAGTTIP